MTLAELLEEVVGELEGVAELDRAALIARLLAELPALLRLYARQRGLKLEAEHVEIVDERAEP